MVREFGLSTTLGPVGYPEGGSVFLGGGGAGLSSRPFAEATQAIIDAEVANLLRTAEKRASELLTTHRKELGKLAELLLNEETVDGTAVYRLIGKPVPTEQNGSTVAPRRVAALVADSLPHSARPLRGEEQGTAPGKGAVARASE